MLSPADDPKCAARQGATPYSIGGSAVEGANTLGLRFRLLGCYLAVISRSVVRYRMQAIEERSRVRTSVKGAFRLRSPVGAHTHSQRRISEEAIQPLTQGGWVVGRDQKAGRAVIDNVSRATHVRRDHG